MTVRFIDTLCPAPSPRATFTGIACFHLNRSMTRLKKLDVADHLPDDETIPHYLDRSSKRAIRRRDIWRSATLLAL